MLKQTGVKQRLRVFEDYLDLACSTNKGGHVSCCDVLKVCPVDTVKRCFLGNLKIRSAFQEIATIFGNREQGAASGVCLQTVHSLWWWRTDVETCCHCNLHTLKFPFSRMEIGHWYERRAA
jgi:hypothetical protein